MSVSFVYPGLLWLLLLAPLIAGLGLMQRRTANRTRLLWALVLRLLILVLMVLSLSGAQLRTHIDTLTVVLVLDVSDSVPAVEQARGETIIRAAVESMPTGDQAAVVVFGQDALVERLASGDPTLPDLASVPVTARTDIGSALQLAMALFPDEGAKRLVLLSDGRENIGHALSQSELAAAQGIELVFVSLGGPEGEAEVLLEELDAPPYAREGQELELEVSVRSTVQIDAALRVFGDGNLVHSQEVRLQPGVNRFAVPVQSVEAGFRRYRAQVVPNADTWLQNNQASAFTLVEGPPRVLLIEGQAGEGDSLARALQAANTEVVTKPPQELQTALPDLAEYDAVVLLNVPAAGLPLGAMEALQVYVRDLGRGLLMIGGENSFGAGGYLRTPLEETLPVDMDVRSREKAPNLALVLVVDKSGSMGRCHCDNPDALPGEYLAVESGQTKVDIAKEAVMRAAAALGPQDYLGVLAFDQAARWALQMRQLVDVVELERSIGSVAAEGQTNMRVGVETAYDALSETDAKLKHVILLTDGWVREGELTGLAAEMREQGITLSVVAAGSGSARYLEELARQGGGRYYPAVDILRVPDFFLKETVKAVGQYVIEEPFYALPGVPHRVLAGIDVATLPPLLGYNGATPKGTARVVLGTPRGDPLLATWQYGLGQAAAWTSDLKGQWAAEWVAWDGLPRFAAQLIGAVLPAPSTEGIAAEARMAGDAALVSVTAVDEFDRPLDFLDVSATVIGPDLSTQETKLAQIGPGSYQASLDLAEAGTYMVRVGAQVGDQALGQQTLGLVVPFSPEYRLGGTDSALLGELAGQTGGEELASPEEAFLHNLLAADQAHEIWRGLLLAAALLFPLDIAVRRLVISRRDLQRGIHWLRGLLPHWRPMAQAGQPILGRLFAARERARERRPRAANTADAPDAGRVQSARTPGQGLASRVPPILNERTAEVARSRPGQAPDAEPEITSAEDTLARLRKAKGRAHQDSRDQR